MAVDKDRLYKKLEHVGEMVVRENLANGVYGENRRGLVEEWLKQCEDRSDADALELAEEREEERSELAAEASHSAREEDRPTAPASPPASPSASPSENWYQRPLGIAGLTALAALVAYLIYFFGWR